nr:MAG TPA: hydrolase-like protein [Caudoviricetes sp.]
MPNVRTITFAATSKGVTPTGPQEAGVQGDHNATVVVWQLDETLLNEAYRYRCEYVDGSGGWDTTPYLALESGNTISVPLPRAWTAAGGCAVIRLCVSEFTEGREERSIYTLTGRLQYAGRESGGAMAEEYEDKLPALIMAVTESMNEAEAAAAGAEAAAAGANEAASRASGAAAAAEEAAMTANAAAASANRLSETMNNELHGEAIHLTYEIGGFDVSQGGEVVAAIRARPVDKAIFVRNGMRVTGGGTYQVDVTEVDSAGAVVKHLCNYADEYVMQEDGYIRFSVKSVANPTAAVTEEDLLLIAEKVVILNDNSVDKRFERMSATLEAETGKLAERMSNELYGEFLRFGYEIGGFDIVDGEVNTKVRARPVDKAIFVRKGMRVTGGGVYQVYVVAVDSTGAALEVLCSYANEYVAQADGYIRYTVKSIANPTAELTEADLPLIAEKVVIRKDDNVNKRIGTLAETMNNELYGEALHLEYEVGGFDASLGQVNTKVRARPVDKAIFVRKGMRITGGGTYQVDVTAVDSAGAVVKHLCSYADEYVMQADGYIRYTVKSIENPTVELTEADLPAIAEKVVILNDNSMDKRLEALEKSDRFWATSGTWDIRQGFSGSDYTQNANGNVDVPADTVLYRDAVTDLLFQKLTWTFKVNTVGAFAFGTRDGSGAANGYYVLVNPADKTLKIYNSDWKGTLSIKRNLTIDFDILAGETYYAEIIKTGTLSTEFTLKCISAPGKTFSYTHNQLNNKLRGWGGVAFGSAGGVFELVNMTQKARSEAECEVLLIGDSFLENASSELSSEYAYAYKLREKLGEKLIASGRGGATTTALKNKYTTDFLAAKAKYTVLQIGSNDSLSLTVATFKMNLLELIGRVEENGSIPVLVTIPRRYDTDNTAFITEVNAWIKSLGYWYIDEYALLPADRLLNDTIHPNAEGHDLILSNLLALIPV